MPSELSSGKSVVIVAVVFGCFAILWPKIFYPMFFGQVEEIRRPDHLRPERPPHLGGGDFPHPGMRGRDGKMFYGEEGRQLKRTIDKELRPGPVPGMRPSMGGPGMQPQLHQKGQGSMGILMPLYTVGIVIFFVYTVMKIIFKKNDDAVESSANGAGGKAESAARGGAHGRYPGGMHAEYLSKERNLLNSMKKAAAAEQLLREQQQAKEQEEAKAKERRRQQQQQQKEQQKEQQEDREEKKERSKSPSPQPADPNVPIVLRPTDAAADADAADSAPAKDVDVDSSKPLSEVREDSDAEKREEKEEEAVKQKEGPAEAGERDKKVSGSEAESPSPSPPLEEVTKVAEVKKKDEEEKIEEKKAGGSAVEEIKELEDPRDLEIYKLKQRLLETEKAMEKIVAQMITIQPAAAAAIAGEEEKKEADKEEPQQ